MRIETRFMRSAVARRVFWVVLAAAALPLLLFAALAYGVLAERLDATQTGRLQEGAKYAALRVYDRLVSAKSALAAMSAMAVVDARHRPIEDVPPVVRDIFTSVITVEHDTGAVEGHQELADAWRQATADGGDAEEQGRRSRWWVAASGTEARVMLGVRDARRWWIGELAPAFLWGEMRDHDAWSSTCVADARGQLLLCPNGPVRPDRAADAAAGWHSVSWSLFTRADFGTVDWVFTRRAARSLLAFGELPLEQVALKAAAFSLLLVVGLSLVLVRRTTVPLEQLMAGTRRLAQRDWAARVQVSGGDEFGELAGSLNDMAERIERQMQALQVQSGIDREILSNQDLPRVLAQVLTRVQTLVPTAHVGLALATEPAGRWLRVASDNKPAAPVALDPDLLRRVESGPATLRGAEARLADRVLHHTVPDAASCMADLGGVLQVFPARASGRTRALLMLRSPEPADADTTGEIEDLCDRLAVMLVATERERELRERAVRDSLTGLLNRAGLIEALDQRLANPDVAAFVLAFIDLDGFKAVNDTRGHTVGDALLCEVAALLRQLAPTTALLARPGGDEFVLLLPGDATAADALCLQLCRQLAQPFVVHGQTLRIGASIGLARCPEDGHDRVELMRHADLAMYAGKAAGRGRHAWFEPSFDERAAERAWVQAELPGALLRGELCVHYQPRVIAGPALTAPGAGPARLASVEALVRWPHPVRGMIPPARFVPLAEETGLVDDLGRWVLDAACRQQRQWRDAGVPVPRVSVNVSALQLADEGFAEQVMAVLQRHGLQPTDLELELTESLFAGDTDAVTARLSPLRAAGVQVALDDFGTGFSSLSSLYRLPVDVLKIDRSFVIDLGRRASADAVARSIVALARALGKHVVAEGVETDEQLQHLVALGCDELQGYLFSRPLPAGQLAAWLQHETTPA